MMPLPTGGYTDMSYGWPMGMPPAYFGPVERSQEEVESLYREQVVAQLASQHVHNLVHIATQAVLQKLQHGARDYGGVEDDATVGAMGANSLLLDDGSNILVQVIVTLDHLDLTPPSITPKEDEESAE